MSVAGPVGAYEYHALSSDGRVADASAFSPSPAEVVVTILARDGDVLRLKTYCRSSVRP